MTDTELLQARLDQMTEECERRGVKLAQLVDFLLEDFATEFDEDENAVDVAIRLLKRYKRHLFVTNMVRI
jgi:hypothetical protein